MQSLDTACRFHSDRSRRQTLVIVPWQQRRARAHIPWTLERAVTTLKQEPRATTLCALLKCASPRQQGEHLDAITPSLPPKIWPHNPRIMATW